MKTLSEYVQQLPANMRNEPLVAQAIHKSESLQLDAIKLELEQEIAQKKGKPYLHALETSKLKEKTYDEIMAEILPLENKLGTLYYHIPFCTKRCTYCHYYKEIGVEERVINSYSEYLEKEYRMILEKTGRDKLSAYSIHYGGGTPSLLSIDQWDVMFDRLNKYIEFDEQDEVAIECSPENATLDKMRHWKQRGVNRMSLGVQSFSEDVLKLLNRQHDRQMGIDSYHIAVAGGFENVNIDLMHSMPGRTLENWLFDIHTILDMEPESVTIYPTRPDPADSVNVKANFPSEAERLFAHIMASYAFFAKGYIQYSPNQYIKSYKGACVAKRERNRCQEVLGMGPLAHSIIKNWFYFNKETLEKYLETIGRGELCKVKGARMSRAEEKVRYIQFGLKLSGINKPAHDNGMLLNKYHDLFGEPVEKDFGRHISYLKNIGLVQQQNGNIHLTEQGFSLTREVLRYFQE